MTTIPLTQGKLAIVDDDDYERLASYNWYARHIRNRWIPATSTGPGGRATIMSRLVMNAPAGRQVDHINHDCLDNRRSNLRLCTNRQNAANQRTRGGRSRYKGVCWLKDRCKWAAQIGVDYDHRGLGEFHSEEDAARAYDKAAREAFGEFACLNFPDEIPASAGKLVGPDGAEANPEDSRRPLVPATAGKVDGGSVSPAPSAVEVDREAGRRRAIPATGGHKSGVSLSHGE